MVTDPANSIFFYGGDHMGVSPAAELLAEGLKCRAGGRETPARARYVGAQVDSKLANTVRTGDVLMLIECEVDGIAEIDGVHPKGTTVVLEVTSSGSAKAAQQIPLRMCLSERLRQELAICSSPVYNWEPRFVVEWIEYHRTLGVQHVYLYDRELRYEGPLQSLIKEGAVTVIPWKSHCPKNDCTAGVGEYFDQFGALDACKQRFGHATEWLAHIDMDERLYMAPAQRKLYGADFKNFLHRIRCNAPSVAEVSLNSIIYYGQQVDKGSLKGLQSHHFKTRDAASTKGFLEKYFARAEAIDVMGVHHAEVFVPPWTGPQVLKPDERELRINHHRRSGKKLPRNLLARFVSIFEGDKVTDTEHLWLGKVLNERVHRAMKRADA